MGLFENLTNRHRQKIQERNQKNLVNSNAFNGNSTLYRNITQNNSNSDNIDIGGLVNTGLKAWNTFGNSGTTASAGTGVIGNAANNFIGGASSNGIIGDAANNYISSGASNGGAITDAIGSSGGGFSSAPWGAITNTSKGLYNGISGKSPKDYSDTEQAVIYPLQGAANGFSVGGPWGALGGALYGLGYAFKDDLGLKDNNFMTQLLFPIGMGDGGGLKISGEPVMDIL